MAERGTAQAVIEAALSQVGYYAPADPEPGSKYGRWMADLTGEEWLRGPSDSVWWCCMFVSWCLDQGGAVCPGFPSYNTDTSLGTGARGHAVDPWSVQYGDIVIFDWNWDGATDHIGFAIGGCDGNGSFPTVEGNIGNAVCLCQRDMGNVAYVIRPPYGGYAPEPEPQGRGECNREGGKLRLDGVGGALTVGDWQAALGFEEPDEVISSQCRENYAWFSAVTAVEFSDQPVGSQLVERVQRIMGLEGEDVDGIWGPVFSHRLQQTLVDGGYSVGPCGIDDAFGHDSVVALQQSINDGFWDNR